MVPVVFAVWERHWPGRLGALRTAAVGLGHLVGLGLHLVVGSSSLVGVVVYPQRPPLAGPEGSNNPVVGVGSSNL